jgi:ferric-dicitrate binding protein FerR (iron transport regulator)
MPDSPFIDPELLDRYLTGDVTAGETAAVERILGDAQAIRARADLAAGMNHVEPDWARLYARIHENGTAPGAVPPSSSAIQRLGHATRSGAPDATRSLTQSATPGVARRGRTGWLLPARGNVTRLGMLGTAAAVLVVATGYLAIRGGWLSHTPQYAVQEYHTGAAEQMRVTLPDGSTVALAPQSRITFDKPFGASSSRTVTLDGQALFTVTHAAEAPFIVQTGDVTTRVLGTSFAVRRYAQDTAVQIVVAQGRVAVGNTVLGTGDIATAHSARQITVSRGNAVTEQLAWTEGRLVFSGTLLRDAIPMLERWYGVTVTVDDPALLDRRVTTTLGPEPTARAMELVAFTVEGRATLRGTHVVIHSH